jgi:DNA helicase-2/ATP-dependent DNA helicase PcrA
MSLSKISNASAKAEQIIHNRIFNSIDNYEDIIFNAGAGSGKTYALIESLKYIVKNHGDRLAHHNQKIICITYTNAAADEIKKRLGNSELVKVSTIHEKLWEIIKKHQKELLIIHLQKLEEELDQIKNNLNENSEVKIEKQFSVYRNLTPDLKRKFREYIFAQKDIYHKNYTTAAPAFRAAFGNDLKPYPNILKSVGNFRKIVNAIFKIDNYKHCIEQIDAKTEKYREVKYDSKYNNDILHRMLISHDTLLEYSLKMVEKYDLLKQVIIDSYPYILIDEYQDTHKKVVEIMQHLAKYSNEIQHKISISYFGDTAQNIYDDGVGIHIKDIHHDLKEIDKIFNRRSYSEIIDVINKIRNDKIEQKSIYDDCTGGSVKFYSCGNTELNKNELIERFITKYHKQWQITTYNKLHCLVLTNKLVAELSGFPFVYQGFATTAFYKKYYDRINTELLSNELTKLGEVAYSFYKVIEFKTFLNDPKTALTKLFHEELYSGLTLFELKELVVQLRDMRGVSLGEYIRSIFAKYNQSKNGSYFRRVIKRLISLDKYSYNGFFNYLLDLLFPDLDSDDNEKIDEANKKIDFLLNIDLSQYTRWYNFINNRQDADVVYHTYHGTKGIEFENVIIVMENDFGRMNKHKFSSFFKNSLNPGGVVDENERHKYEDTKNLLYVSCSRAIKRLRILYLDDTSDFSDGIKNIFSEVNCYLNGTNSQF